MLLKRIPDRGFGLMFPSQALGLLSTPAHGFDHRLLKGPEAGGEGRAPALQNVTEAGRF